MRVLNIPALTTRSQRVDSMLVMAYILAVSGMLLVALSHWRYDDPFITFRYADNVCRGVGLVYNAGQRALSTTTPLYALLLSPFVCLGLDVSLVSVAIGCISLAVGALLLARLARLVGSTGRREAKWAAWLLYPTCGPLLITLGSEMPFYLALCLGALVAVEKQRHVVTGVCVALAILTRGDATVLAAVIAARLIVRRERVPWIAVAAGLGIAGVWVVFATAYFGSPIPLTLRAKQYQGLLAASQPFLRGLAETAGWFLPHAAYWLFAALSVIGLAVWVRTRDHPWSVLLIWLLAYCVAYSALGISHYFWYTAPLVPGLVALAGLGAGALGRWFFRRWPRAIRRLPIALALVCLVAGAQWLDVDRLRQIIDWRYDLYRRAGEWLSANSPADATIGALEIGIIGYHARRPMIDFAGLIQPDVAAQLATARTFEDSAVWATLRYRPSYLALVRGQLPALVANATIHTSCRIVQSLEDSTHDHAIDLYQCWH